MKIIEMPPYYLPEQISSTHLTRDLTEALVVEGYQIENYVPTPCRGLSNDEIKKYSTIKYEEMYDGNVKIFRFKMMKEGHNPLLRAIRYSLVNLIQLYKGKNAKDVDIIIGGSTPPIQGLMCGKVSRILSRKRGVKVPFLYLLQDVFPDSLITTGLAKKGDILWKIGRIIEDKIYSNADKIIVISNGIKDNIVEKGVEPEKIEVISNWVDTDEIHPINRDNNILFDELSIDKTKYIVCYAGNLGAAQGAEVIIEAAKQLNQESNILFVIFGRGINYQAIEKKIKEENIHNVQLFPIQPKEKIAHVYSLGDLNLITCKKGVGSSGLPSKVWTILACNGDIIASVDNHSDLSEILIDSGAGMCVEPENPKALANAILKKYESSNKKNNKGREYVLLHASKEICVKKYVEVIEKMIQDARSYNRVNK